MPDSSALPVTLQVCPNGSRAPGGTPPVPVAPGDVAAAVAAAVAAGADGAHLHPRDAAGAESLAPDDVAAVVTAVRAGVPAGVEVNLTTGLWVAADARARHDAVAAWHVLPDAVSVNWHEDGATALAGLLLDRGVGVDAGLWTVEDCVAFLGWERRAEANRILVEVSDNEPVAGMASAAAMVAVLHRGGLRGPFLVHGEGGSTWPVLRWAAERGHQLRIGLEDTLLLPDDTPAADNAALVRAAASIPHRART
jgi:uncharacterized protein (DUF849 family)